MTVNTQLTSIKVLQVLTKNKLIPSIFQKIHFKSRSQNILSNQFIKRAFDVLFSLSVLIVFLPLYLLLSFLIAISSPGPIFYFQERAGKNFKKFKKLRNSRVVGFGILGNWNCLNIGNL